ncbi:hypothetical protein AHAS_Ahas01G0155400 [Arachis hypogaea]
MSRSVAVVLVECKRYLCNINPWTEFCIIKVVYVPSYPPCFDDIIGKEVVLKVNRKRVGYTPYIGTFKVINCCDDVGVISKFMIEEVSNEVTSIPMLLPVFEDFGQNAKFDVNLRSLGCRLSIPPEILRIVGVDIDAFIDKHNFQKPDENFTINGSDLLFNLVAKKIICMVDPNGVQEYPRTIFYNVFRSSDDSLLIKLFEDAIGNQMIIGDESFHVDSRGDTFPSASIILLTKVIVYHHPTNFPHHLIYSKKLNTQFDSRPTSARKILEDAFEAWTETNAIGGHKP